MHLNYGTHMQLWSLSCQHLCDQHPLASQEEKKQKKKTPICLDFSALKIPRGGCMNRIKVFFSLLHFKYNLLVGLLIHVIKEFKELLRLSHKSKTFLSCVSLVFPLVFKK